MRFKRYSDRQEEAHALSLIGQAALALSQFDEATAAYDQALLIQRDLEQADWVMDSLAAQLRIAMAQGRSLAADAGLTAGLAELLEYLETSAIHDNDDPFAVYLTVYRALQATADPRADTFLRKACDLLQTKAEVLGEAKGQFLTGIASHQALLAALSEL